MFYLILAGYTGKSKDTGLSLWHTLQGVRSRNRSTQDGRLKLARFSLWVGKCPIHWLICAAYSGRSVWFERIKEPVPVTIRRTWLRRQTCLWWPSSRWRPCPRCREKWGKTSGEDCHAPHVWRLRSPEVTRHEASNRRPPPHRIVTLSWTQRCLNAGPASPMLAQHWDNVGSTSHKSW